MNIQIKRILRLHSALLLLVCCTCTMAQAVPEMAGLWVFNEDESDNTDKKVEQALKAMGQKVKRSWFSRDREKYRGGPEDQELYDRISYDLVLNIDLSNKIYLFTYADNYQRPVYSDNRSRSISLTNLDEVEDFSFAHWEDNILLVEARPRDGGFADERYELINNGTQLEVTMYIQPRTFNDAIEIKRVFDRQP